MRSDQDEVTIIAIRYRRCIVSQETAETCEQSNNYPVKNTKNSLFYAHDDGHGI